MKRLFGIMLVLLLSAGAAFAAPSVITWTDYTGRDGSVQIVASVTANTTDATITTTEFKNKNGASIDLTGYLVYSVTTIPGATGPTDNSDLEIVEHSASGRDVLGGSGTNAVDNTATNYVQPRIGTDESGNALYGAQPVYGTLYLKISNNAVNSALITVIVRLIKL